MAAGKARSPEALQGLCPPLGLTLPELLHSQWGLSPDIRNGNECMEETALASHTNVTVVMVVFITEAHLSSVDSCLLTGQLDTWADPAS